jgi:gentisate 1,2-dioxygenase
MKPDEHPAAKSEHGVSSALEREGYYERIGEHNMAPLWKSLHLLVPSSPRSPAVPTRWDYDGVIRTLLMEAGGLITAREAERRVLILENPGLKGQASITRSLYAGLQLVLPGEVAPAHRHTQSALRFILEGSGAYTAIDGEQVFMSPGDLILTPSWRFHDHGNETDAPIVWLDGLDIPTLAFFDAGFAEPANAERQTITLPPGDSQLRYGADMAPVDWRPSARASPVLKYPYARSREVLEGMRRADPPDPWHGYKMRYVNPATGGSVFPTIGAFIQLIDAGQTTAPYRSTDGTVLVVVEGTGVATIGDKTFSWKPRDILVAPSWAWRTLRADTETVLFSFSDRPMQEAFDLFRQEQGRAA